MNAARTCRRWLLFVAGLEVLVLGACLAPEGDEPPVAPEPDASSDQQGTDAPSAAPSDAGIDATLRDAPTGDAADGAEVDADSAQVDSSLPDATMDAPSTDASIDTLPSDASDAAADVLDALFDASDASLPALALPRLAVGNEPWMLRDDGALYTWGAIHLGALNTFFTDDWVRAAGSLTFSTIAASPEHVCGISLDGKTYCWGGNLGGKVGMPAGAEDQLCSGIQCHALPYQVNVPEPLVRVAAGWLMSCGLASSGAAYCWGHLPVGDAGFAIDQPPTLMPGGPFRSFTGNSSHVCGVRLTGEAVCWGSSNGGALGSVLPAGNYTAPQVVAGGHTFSTVSIGLDSSCGLTAGGSVYCWGAGQPVGDAGQNASVPSLVPLPAPTQRVASSLTDGACAAVSGQVWCWGPIAANPAGTLSPVQIGGLPVPNELVAGNSIACTRTGDDIYCWGQVPKFGSTATPVLVRKPDAGPVADASALDASAGPGCPNGASYSFAAPTQMTIWEDHPYLHSVPSGAVSIYSCASGQAALSLGNEGTVTAALPAGQYGASVVWNPPEPPLYTQTYYSPTIIVEPVPPPATNVDQSTAIPLVSGGGATGRSVANETRFYSVTLIEQKGVTVYLQVPEPVDATATLFDGFCGIAGFGPTRTCGIQKVLDPGTHFITIRAGAGGSFDFKVTF